MVVRVFRVRVHPGKEDQFERFVIETGIPMVKAQEGCTHVTAGKSRWSEQPEFVVVTHWRSVDALKAFAVPDWQEAVIEPEEEHMLAEVFCDHYETIEDGLSRQSGGLARTLWVGKGLDPDDSPIAESQER